MSNDDDVGFLSLGPNLRSRIDNAFHTALASDQQRDTSPFTVGLTHDPPGGFLLNDDDSMAGGFLPPSPPAVVRGSGNEREGDERPSFIPLSRIPYALQLLDLSPDDPEVLAVFRNAATGWGDDHISAPRSTRRGRNTTEGSDETDECVSLKDWRAVCAALLDDGGDEEGAKEAGDVDIDGDDDDNAGDVDQNSSSGMGESSYGSSDEYHDAETVAKSRKWSRKSTSASTAGHKKATRKARPRKTQSATPRRGDSVSASADVEITPRQRRECLQAFLLFFPGVPEDVAKLRRLGVRELSGAATVLNEKIQMEEVRQLDFQGLYNSRMTAYR